MSGVFVRAKCDKCGRWGPFELPQHVADAWERDAARHRGEQDAAPEQIEAALELLRERADAYVPRSVLAMMPVQPGKPSGLQENADAVALLRAALVSRPPVEPPRAQRDVIMSLAGLGLFLRNKGHATLADDVTKAIRFIESASLTSVPPVEPPCETCNDSGLVEENHGPGLTEILSCPDCGHRRDYSKPDVVRRQAFVRGAIFAMGNTKRTLADVEAASFRAFPSVSPASPAPERADVVRMLSNTNLWELWPKTDGDFPVRLTTDALRKFADAIRLLESPATPSSPDAPRGEPVAWEILDADGKRVCIAPREPTAEIMPLHYAMAGKEYVRPFTSRPLYTHPATPRRSR